MIKEYEEKFINTNIPKLSTILQLSAYNTNEGISVSTHGYFVIGVEITDAVMPFIYTKIEMKPIDAELKSLNIKQLDFLPESFNAGLLLRHTLEYIPYRANRIAILEYMSRSIKDDGFVIISLWNKSKIRTPDYWEKRNYYIKSASSIPDIDIETGDLFFHGSQVQFLHLYDNSELEEDMNKAGLKIISINSELEILQDQHDIQLSKDSEEKIVLAGKI